MQTLAKGQALLERLRQAGIHADTNNRHATKAACYSIERVLEALQLRRRQLDDLWKGRKKNLEQSVKKCKIEEEAKRVSLLILLYVWNKVMMIIGIRFFCPILVFLFYPFVC